VDRIKRLSYEVLEEHKPKFGVDFADNKKVLDQIAIIRSKGLKNEIAGYITKFIKKEIREENTKQSQIESSKLENYTLKEKISEDEDVIQEQDIEIISESETNEDAEE
jgi:small subunit ribosomal protein S17e